VVPIQLNEKEKGEAEKKVQGAAKERRLGPRCGGRFNRGDSAQRLHHGKHPARAKAEGTTVRAKVEGERSKEARAE